jgi:putative membrane protein
LVMVQPGAHHRLAAALAAAETKTSGEMFCIVADEVSKYREVPIAWGAGVALLLPPAALLLGLHPWTLGSFGGGWNNAPNLGEVITETLSVYAVAQAILFAVAAFIVAIPAVRRHLTPHSLKQHRVKRTAFAHFASTGLSQVQTRTGVLIFASLKDRQVELVADAAIHKEVGDQAWNAAVAALVAGIKSPDPASGFVRAIEICGEALAEHFPSNGPHASHGDGVVEL